MPVEQHLTGGASAGSQVVHPIEDAQEGRLTAARRTDQRRDPASPDRQCGVVQRLEIAVEEVDVAGIQLDLGIAVLHGPGGGFSLHSDGNHCAIGAA